jgi:hypothetical protein
MRYQSKYHISRNHFNSFDVELSNFKYMRGGMLKQRLS